MSFASPEILRREFDANIANGGIFIETRESFEIRQSVTVDIELSYASGAAGSLSLEGEVVHRVPPEMAASGAVPGVAIQFEAQAPELRERFAPLLGQEALKPPPDVDAEGAGRRGSRRDAVRVPVRVMPTMSPPFEATSRDLSATGVLLTVGEIVLPVQEIVRICLWHPTGEKSVEIDAQIVRQVKNKKGRIAALAAAFDRNQAADPRVREVIDALRQAGHRSRLGGISGSIADLGLANMLQMFGSSAPRGTLVVEHDKMQGWVAFAEGDLLGAALGALKGQDALIAMLDWADGRFDFEARVDESMLESPTRRPLEGAILEAVCTLDERAGPGTTQTSNDADWAEQTMTFDVSETSDPGPGAVQLGPGTTFQVDADEEDRVRYGLDKVEEAVVDLAKTGVSIDKLCSIIPESPERIQRAIDELVESGVLRPR